MVLLLIIMASRTKFLTVPSGGVPPDVYVLPTKVETINPILDSFQHLYNYHRLQGVLAELIPAQYLVNLRAGEPEAVSYVLNSDSIFTSFAPASMIAFNFRHIVKEGG